MRSEDGEQMKCQPHRQKVPRTNLSRGFSTKCSKDEFISKLLSCNWMIQHYAVEVQVLGY